MSALLRVNTYHRGDVLFYQGNSPMTVYFICRGSVKLARSERMGRQHILRVVTGPDFLGERAMLAGQPYAASAQVMEDSRICAIDGESFRLLWRGEPELAQMLARHLAMKLKEADEAACVIALHTIREQLARVIVDHLKSDGGGRVTFSESRQDLADLLGTSPEVVSRTLSEFARKKLVTRDGRGLRILDGERLRAVAGLSAAGNDFSQPAACVSSMTFEAVQNTMIPRQTAKKPTFDVGRRAGRTSKTTRRKMRKK